MCKSICFLVTILVLRTETTSKSPKPQVSMVNCKLYSTGSTLTWLKVIHQDFWIIWIYLSFAILSMKINFLSRFELPIMMKLIFFFVPRKEKLSSSARPSSEISLWEVKQSLCKIKGRMLGWSKSKVIKVKNFSACLKIIPIAKRRYFLRVPAAAAQSIHTPLQQTFLFSH